jgi:hypothetical protein
MVAAPSMQDGCPERFEPGREQARVPAVPSAETPGRLAPDADVGAPVCRYAPPAEVPSEPVGGRLLAGDLTEVRSDLALPERLPGQEPARIEIDGTHVPYVRAAPRRR